MKRAVVVLLLLVANVLVTSNTSRTTPRDRADLPNEIRAAKTQNAKPHEADTSVASDKRRCASPFLLTHNAPARSPLTTPRERL